MDIIKEASEALLPISNRGIRVKEGWYDEDTTDTHISLWELSSSDVDYSDDEAESETGTVQVNIWSLNDEIALRDEVKTLMLAYGFTFEAANDSYEDDTELYVKQMRFNLTKEIQQPDETGREE